MRANRFWQSVASGVVIISSVAFYTWVQMKDRDGQGGLMAALKTPENRHLGRFILIIAAVIAALFILGWLFAGETTAVR